MCGIFGAVNASGYFTREQFNKFVSMTDMVRYRGPDAAGYRAFRIKPVKEPRLLEDCFDVFFGHRRLSIIDLSEESNQPFTNDDTIWIIFNGEIFNYVELSKKLHNKGVKHKTQGDTEVIVNTYKAYGERGFSRFNGMWAFALLDIAKKKLILSRDRFSIKPLYYTSSPNGFFFASEIKQLLPFVNQISMHKDSMYAYLKQGLVDFKRETFFQHIYKVMPRHSFIMDLDTGKTEETAYWNFHKEEVPKETHTLIEQFKHLLTDSVRIRLRSDVPLGILLSGGLDSSSIALIASQINGREIECFSSISKEKKYSEEKFIDILKEALKLKVTKFYSDPRSSWEMLDQALYHNEEPFTNLVPVVHYAIMEHIKKSTPITVLLNGQGGDEILCGYKKFFFFYLYKLLIKGKFAPIITNVILSLINQTIIRQFSLKESKRYLPFFKKTDPVDNCLLYKGELKSLTRATSMKERQIRDIEAFSVPYLAHYEDRNSMAHSLEIRMPFLDHRLVNFCLNMPDSLKIRDGWTKYIMRKALTELPRPIAWRKDKQGFLNPETKWVKSDFKNQIMEIFTHSALSELGIVDAAKLISMYKKYLKGDPLLWHADIVRFFVAELWAKKFIINAIP